MLPRYFLTKCSSLLSLVLRAWVVLISALSSVLAMDREWHWKYRCDIDWIFRPTNIIIILYDTIFRQKRNFKHEKN